MPQMRSSSIVRSTVLLISLVSYSGTVSAVPQTAAEAKPNPASVRPAGKTATARVDARNVMTKTDAPTEDQDLRQFGIYASTAPRATAAEPVVTTLPLTLKPKSRIAFIGNTLLERSQNFGQLEALLQQAHPGHDLVIRNLAWSADTPELQPRPENFADLEQHLFHERVDVILAAYGFNESSKGAAGIEDFRRSLIGHIQKLRSLAFNGVTAPQIVLLSPVAAENISGTPAADLNNEQLELYSDIVRQVASQLNVGFVDAFTVTKQALADSETDLTINGVHLTKDGYRIFATDTVQQLLGRTVNSVNEAVRTVVVDKNRQYFRRYRPLNTFYYTGGRKASYGYLDFLPAMRNFDLMASNRDQRIWAMVKGEPVAAEVDDSNLPPLPETKQSRGANRWMSAEDELDEFKVDPRFEVTLFAGEEEFPDIAAPIQIRWDNRGRLWVSCSTTYPHVYPGNQPNDKIVILEDTDGDGKADKSTVFADDLHIPLSFEFGDGGVYVSEQPQLTFLKDTDGDDKADERTALLTGFGTEDSHHSLHDFAWTPDGDLIFRESIFHHSQVETAYGPVRQQNSGWFRYHPASRRLTSFGSYHSTNPWGVTFDDWGQHVASHPVYAAAFHSLDPPYPTQHAKPTGLTAYSGTCGQEFVDFDSFPAELQGHYIKARYKPTNRIEIHQWNEQEFGYDEKYVGDLIFSSNLSFIPVDIRFGPRGSLYICDWYNPVKGHAQYSLRDERRDRHSGRIWRVTAKNQTPSEPPKYADASVTELIDVLRMPQSRYRYWARRELRERDATEVRKALDTWLASLDSSDNRYRHHQVEAMWVYRGINRCNTDLIIELIGCESRHARAAAIQQLRYLHQLVPGATDLLRRAANDPKSVVRMEAAIAATYIGTLGAFEAVTDVLNHPLDDHLAYAVSAAFGSKTMLPYWQKNDTYGIRGKLRSLKRKSILREPPPSASEAEFDTQSGLTTVGISCLPERMKFTVEQIPALVGQPLKIVFKNPDATDHNLVIVKPGALMEVGVAANEMARDPKNANSNFIPKSKRNLILHSTPMIGPSRKSQVHVMRFNAPKTPGVYPYVCTFPGHWIVMKGELVVAADPAALELAVASRKPQIVKQWTLEELKHLTEAEPTEENVLLGLATYMKAGCNQCHQIGGHGINVGPKLTGIGQCYKAPELLKHLIDPSAELHDNFATQNLLLYSGQVIGGVVVSETDTHIELVPNLLTPTKHIKIAKSEIEERIKSKVSGMPEGLLDILTPAEIANLLTFLRTDAGAKVGIDTPVHQH